MIGSTLSFWNKDASLKPSLGELYAHMSPPSDLCTSSASDKQNRTCYSVHGTRDNMDQRSVIWQALGTSGQPKPLMLASCVILNAWPGAKKASPCIDTCTKPPPCPLKTVLRLGHRKGHTCDIQLLLHVLHVQWAFLLDEVQEFNGV